MTWQGYPPSSTFDADEPSYRRFRANSLRERRAARATGMDLREPTGDGRTARINLRTSRGKLRRYRRARIIGGLAAAALVGWGAVTFVMNSNAAAANPNCTLIVPANPLTAAGLATPYQLVATNPADGVCNEANADQSAYVQGAILSADGQLTLYNPLVIDKGTQPAAPPAAAQVPAGAVVGLWFGFNGTNLTLQSAAGSNSLQQGVCVNGNGGSIFGQFAYCNAPAFFAQANKEIAANMLQVPDVGTAKDGLPCPTVRDFSLVDMDQSDNVTTHYLANAKGRIAQPNAAARAALQDQQLTDLFNGSDNRLLDAFVDPTLGCQPWTRPEQSNDGQAASSLALNELQAAAKQAAPVAVVPLTDPMTLNAAGNQSTAKTNAYRVGVDQLAIGAAGADPGTGQTYCTNLFTNAAGIQRVFKDQAILVNGPSPDAGAANNLFTFLANRANDAFAALGCTGNSPIQLTMNGNGVVVAATFVPGGAAQAGNANAGNANGGAATGGAKKKSPKHRMRHM